MAYKENRHAVFQKKGALLLAPMVGISNRAFRTLVWELGAPDYAFTEMAGAEGFLSGAPYDDIYLDPGPDPSAISIQFNAKSPAALAEACRRVAEWPVPPRGIDINFGCSAPKIRRAGAGSAWSDKPEGAAGMVAAARLAWPGLLSAKLRSGADQNAGRLSAFCRALADEGLDFITLHPRTDGQKFRGKANEDLLGVLCQALPIPVVANGDIRSAQDAARIMAQQGPAALMLGREAARRPWIFCLLRSQGVAAAPMAPDSMAALAAPVAPKAQGPFDLLAIALRYLDLAEALLPAAWQLESARRIFAYYAENLSFVHYARTRLVNAPSLDAMRLILADYFDKMPSDRIVTA